MKCWLPQPLFSLCLWMVWLLLGNTLAPGQMLLGAVLALALPLFSVRFWPDRPRLRRPLQLLRYFAVLLWDIVVANLVVARLILGPTRKLRPAFIRLPLDLCHEFAIVVLANTISLTPGTVSADLSLDRRTLLIHALDVEDEAQAIARIKDRYERPLKEIFEC
ncbi:MAG: Na+/H+ antiporter subunit E [Desulfoprunum sp.]|jgi:multicomponent K+:H+ antiporter subunit E|uniref:Na+/H+ antiporter subunit E n=1 Tax=Desulfoprunum sp. TaxID=2020866 RepID=UPI00052C803B|nr:cation:proton antiporter [Desulfobulbus sp. Tol-SR]